MKNTLILFLIALFFVACNKKSNVDYILFSGKIENSVGKIIEVYGGDFNKTIALHEDGSFADTLQILPGYYTFRYDRKISTLYLKSGDDLHLILNTREFDKSIIYSGKGSESNNYLTSKHLRRTELLVDLRKSGGVNSLYALKENKFLESINSLRTFSKEFLKNAKISDKNFSSLEKKSIEYKYIANLQSYLKDHAEISDDFMKILNDELNTIDYKNNQDYKNFASYRFLVKNHYYQAINNSENVSLVFEELKSIDAPNIIKDLIGPIYRDIRPRNKDNDEYYKGLMDLLSDDKLKEKLTYKYNQLKVLKKGMPSPVFENYENHKGGTTSLKDLIGKYVYIDIWAIWCPPCIKEFPYLKKLESKYHGKIESVSISIDVDYDKWFKMVNDKELGGIQLRNYKGGLLRNSKEKFFRDYAIEGVPRFILIDPFGNIINAEAPRPSDPKLIEIFNELNI